MKALKVTIVFIFVFQFSYAQISKEVKNRIDLQYGNIPTCELFAGKLNYDFKSRLDKVGAIYYWIAKNVKYNEESFFNKKKKYHYNFKYKTKEEKETKIQEVDIETADDTYSKRLATYREFALLFKKLCDNCGVECVVISGSTKSSNNNIGKEPGRGNHMWNAVKIDDKWQLIDVTWGAGTINYDQKSFYSDYNEVYFLTSPDRFFLTHFPKDPQWLLIDKKEEDFASLPLFHPFYIKSDFQIAYPKTGIINTSENKNVNVKIDIDSIGVKFDQLSSFSYAYESERRLVMIMPNNNNGQLNFEIPIKPSKSDFLTIFCNENALVTYKIESN